MLQVSFIKLIKIWQKDNFQPRTQNALQLSLISAWSCFYPTVSWWDNEVQLQVAALLAVSAGLLRPARHSVGQEVADGAGHCRDLCQHWHWWHLLVYISSVISALTHFPGKIKEVFLFDSDTTVGFGFREAGTRKGFILTNSSRKIVIKCFKRRIAERWVRTIKASLGEGPGRELASQDKRWVILMKNEA